MFNLTVDQKHQLLGLIFTGIGVVALYGLWTDFKRGVTKMPRAFSRPIQRADRPVFFWMVIIFQLAIYGFLFWLGVSALLIGSGVAPVWPLINFNY